MSGATRFGASLRYAVRGIASRGISIAAAFAMTSIILKTLHPADGGKFSFIYAVLLGLATVSRMGLENLLLKQVAADPNLARPRLGVSFGSAATLSALAALALFSFSLFYLNGVPWPAVLLLASAIIPLNLSLLAGALLRGLGWVTAGSIAELGSLPGITFVVLLLARLLRGSFGLPLVCLVLGGAAYVTAAWSLPLALIAIRRVSAPAPAEPVRTFWRGNGASLWQFMVTGLGYYLFSNVPSIVLGVKPVDNAHFAAARTFANLVGTVPTIQIAYLSPLFANLFHHGKLAELNRLIRRQTIAGTAAAGVLALPLLVVPVWVLHVIYPPGFSAATAPTLQLLAVAVLLQVALGPVQGLLVTCGFERAAARTTLVMLVGGTVLMLLVVRWGAPAVAAVNAVANLGFMAAGAWLLRRREGIVSPLGLPTRATPPGGARP